MVMKMGEEKTMHSAVQERRNVWSEIKTGEKKR